MPETDRETTIRAALYEYAEYRGEHNTAEPITKAAAAGYAHTAQLQVMNMPKLALCEPHLWPWASDWWKPSPDPIRNLEKAGALIAAEIDRLFRLSTARGPDGARASNTGESDV